MDIPEPNLTPETEKIDPKKIDVEKMLSQDEKDADPEKIARWNWGAFFLPIIWGIGNRCPIALLTFVPVIGVMIMPFVLGINGNQWAWENKEWPSPQAFHATQRRWAVIGAILFVIQVAAGYWFYTTKNISIPTGTPKKYSAPAKKSAWQKISFKPAPDIKKIVLKEVVNVLHSDNSMLEQLGDPIRVGKTISMRKVTDEISDKMFAEIELKGSKKTTVAYIEATLDTGVVLIQKLVLYFKDPPRKVWQIPYYGESKKAA